VGTQYRGFKVDNNFLIEYICSLHGPTKIASQSLVCKKKRKFEVPGRRSSGKTLITLVTFSFSLIMFNEIKISYTVKSKHFTALQTKLDLVISKAQIRAM
jgi:hypothetical protein